MYSKTAKSTHYLPRTGSYSTVPKRNGRVDVLPPEAEEQLFGELKDRRGRLIEKVKAAQLTLSKLHAENSAGSNLRKSWNEWSRKVQAFHDIGGMYPAKPPAILDWETRRKRAVETVRKYEADLSTLEKVGMPRKIRRQSFLELFVAVAEVMLDSNTFERIKFETNERLRISVASKFDKIGGGSGNS